MVDVVVGVDVGEEYREVGLVLVMPDVVLLLLPPSLPG